MSFDADRLAMSLTFWETGEADFFGVERPSLRDMVGFNCILLNDTTFEAVFRTCIAAVATNNVGLARELKDPISGRRIPSGYDA